MAPMLMGAVNYGGDVNQRLLDAHNLERIKLDIPPLRWSTKLARDAAVWADFLARSNRFMHSAHRPDDPQGENLWRGTRAYFLPEEMVSAWLAERRHFKAGVFPANSRTGRVQDVGHYTQIIWKNTSQVGCALSRGAEYDVLVCRYSSPGNVLGQKPI